MQASAFLDLARQAGFSAMGERKQAADSAKTNKYEAGSFDERLAGLRKAAGHSAAADRRAGRDHR